MYYVIIGWLVYTLGWAAQSFLQNVIGIQWNISVKDPDLQIN